jgi:molybdenum cofactor cytidylyltransferase
LNVKTEVVGVDDAIGKLLTSPIFRPSGKKLLATGRMISSEDVRLLSHEGHLQVSIAVLDPEEVAEDEAALKIGSLASRGSIEVRLAAGGRANLIATQDSCIFVNEAALRQVNRSEAISMATLPNLSFVYSGQRVGTVNSPPFAVSRVSLERAVELLARSQFVIEARAVERPSIGVLYSDPLRGERARTLYEGIMKTRLDRFRAHSAFVLSSVEDEAMLSRNLEHLLRARPSLVLMASTTAPAGPNDVVGRVMSRVGCSIECFLAPVEPGNLLLLAYYGDIPVVAAPGCFRSPKANVVDLVLPPLLARHRLSIDEISTFGHGGLLQ